MVVRSLVRFLFFSFSSPTCDAEGLAIEKGEEIERKLLNFAFDVCVF